MKYNYHTHTVRCKHAVGAEREYIENAIEAGFEILGFSDHSPQFFEDGYVSGMRMLPSEAEEYIACIKGLADEYKNEIKIYAGFEAEYFPESFQRLQQLCRSIGADYLIMGQHFLDRENGGLYFGSPTSDRRVLAAYVDQVLEGVSTGSFSYIAHPDICNFCGDSKAYEEEITRLCREAKRLSVPLEINMLGYSSARHYPSEKFFKTAKSVGNDFVIGCDAHAPQSLINTALQNEVLQLAECWGISPAERIELKKI